jgi:hypothetical protein
LGAELESEGDGMKAIPRILSDYLRRRRLLT